MISSVPELQLAAAQNVVITDVLTIDLLDGRSVSIPLSWFPRLQHGTPEERNHWELVGRGQGIHWPDLDEDISVEHLLLGHASGESQASLNRWLKARSTSTDSPVVADQPSGCGKESRSVNLD